MEIIVEVNNFTSVFEISFALNASLYFFEVLPLQRKRDELDQANNEKMFTALEDQGYRGLDRAPFVEGLKEYQNKFTKILTGITLFNSIVSLGILISAGFLPTLTLNPSHIATILIAVFILPSSLYMISVKYRERFNLFVIGRVIKRTERDHENA